MMSDLPSRDEADYMLASPAFDLTVDEFADAATDALRGIASGRLIDRDTIDYEAAAVEFTRWSRPARLGRRLEQKRNRVGAVRVVQAAIGGSDER